MAELVPAGAGAPPAPAPSLDLSVLNSGTPFERLRGLTMQPAVRRALPWFGGLAAVGAAALTWAMIALKKQREVG